MDRDIVLEVLAVVVVPTLLDNHLKLVDNMATDSMMVFVVDS